MGRKSNYTVEQKLQAVNAYKNKEKSVIELTKELGLHKSGKDIYHWITVYDDLGEEGLSDKKNNKIYSEELKKAAVHDYIAGKGSYKEIARKYGICSPGIVEKWLHKYGEEREVDNIRNSNKNTREELEKLRKENLKLKKEIQMKEKEVILINKVKAIGNSDMVTGGKKKPEYLAVKELHESDSWSINWMCQELKISRAGYYKWLHTLQKNERS